MDEFASTERYEDLLSENKHLRKENENLKQDIDLNQLKWMPK